MGPPGYAGAFGSSYMEWCRAIEPLLPDPKPQEQDSRHPKDEEEEKYFDPGSREHHQVSAQHCWDGAAGADSRYFAIPIEVNMCGMGTQAAQQVENQKAEIADGGFNIVGKDP